MNEQKINVKPSQLENVICNKGYCGCAFFEIQYVLKKIPSTISPNGKAFIQPIPVYVCKKCGMLEKETTPDGIVKIEIEVSNMPENNV